MNNFPFRILTRQGCSLSPHLFNSVLKGLANTMRQVKEIKNIRSGKENVNYSLLEDRVTIQRKHSLDSFKKAVELIIKCSKTIVYTITSQESTTFPYSGNKQSKIEVSKKYDSIKQYLICRDKSDRDVQNLCIKKRKIFFRETKEHIYK